MTNFNVSGIGAGASANGVGKVNDDDAVKKSSGKEEAKKHIKQATDENEQVELDIDDKEPKKKGGKFVLASAINMLKIGLNKVIGGKTGWAKMNDKKEEIQEQHQEAMQKAMQRTVDLANEKEKLIEEQNKAIEDALDKLNRDTMADTGVNPKTSQDESRQLLEKQMQRERELMDEYMNEIDIGYFE